LAVVITGASAAAAAAAGAATDTAAAGAATAAAGAGELLFLFGASTRTAGAGAVTAEDAAGAGAASSLPVAPLVPELPAEEEDARSSETLDRFWRGEGFSAVADPRLPRPAAGAGSSPSLLELLDDDEPPSRPPRSPRAGRDVPDFDALEDEEALDASELEPDDPVVSAYAIGIAAIPVPMPSATARAPIRPI
jgi:hypothetical protein